MQTSALVTFDFAQVPSPHWVHKLAPALEWYPAAQTEHVVAAYAVENLPVDLKMM